MDFHVLPNDDQVRFLKLRVVEIHPLPNLGAEGTVKAHQQRCASQGFVGFRSSQK